MISTEERISDLEQRLETVEALCGKAAALLEKAAANPKVRTLLRTLGLELPR